MRILTRSQEIPLIRRFRRSRSQIINGEVKSSRIESLTVHFTHKEWIPVSYGGSF